MNAIFKFENYVNYYCYELLIRIIIKHYYKKKKNAKN